MLNLQFELQAVDLGVADLCDQPSDTSVTIDGPPGIVSVKHFATIVLPIIRKEQFVKPRIIFRGKRERLGTEASGWDNRVVVHFQEDAWMDTTRIETMYVPLCLTSHAHKKVLLADASGAHFKK